MLEAQQHSVHVKGLLSLYLHRAHRVAAKQASRLQLNDHCRQGAGSECQVERGAALKAGKGGCFGGQGSWQPSQPDEQPAAT